MTEVNNEILEPHVTNCCPNYEAATATTCALCNAPICKNCSEIVENSKICVECFVKILEEQIEKEAPLTDIPMGVLGGLLGSLVGAFLWVAIYVLTKIMIGIAAIGVGYLAGQGVSLFVKRRKAQFLQIISAGFAFLGVILGYLVIYVYITAHSLGPDIKPEDIYFNPKVWLEVLKILPDNLGVFGWIFIAISVYYSWKISAPLNKDRPN